MTGRCPQRQHGAQANDVRPSQISLLIDAQGSSKERELFCDR
jgi:hypothetical protein